VNLERGKRNNIERQNIKQNHKRVKVLIIPFADARSKPRTMMIESFHAVIAVIAMRAARRPNNPTSFACFEQQRKTFVNH
jgi:hypothetical protein